MTKLEDLISKKCPQGVRFFPLCAVADVHRGVRVVKNQLLPIGKYPVFQNSLTPMGFLNSSNEKGGKTYVISAGAAGEIGFCGQDFWAADDCLVISCNEGLNDKYVYYYLMSKKKAFLSLVRKASVPRLSRTVVENAKIPVPPLEVQDEIVRILDNFTELTAELTARKKQYEFYRDVIFDFDEGTKFVPLRELFDTRNGFTPSKACSEFWESGTLPWFRLEDINAHGRMLDDSIQHITPAALKKGGLFPSNSLIISTSATIGEYALITKPFLCNQRFTCLTLKECYKNRFSPEFLLHYFYKLSVYCKANLNKGNFASVDMTKFGNFGFPLIPIEKQREIVSLMDKFDAYCERLDSGLPAEIEARKKQYEYYRDKLLTFKELKE